MKRDHLACATTPGECELTQGCDWTPGAGSCFQEVSALCQPISHVENSVVSDAILGRWVGETHVQLALWSGISPGDIKETISVSGIELGLVM